MKLIGKTMKTAILVGALIGLLGGSAIAAEPQVLNITKTRPQVDLISNVVYEQVPSRGYSNVAMRMDVLKPKAAKAMPAIVYVTGGGFINANKDSYIQQRLDLAERGYVVASIEYRVAPTATMPQPLEDVKSAVRYLRANSKKFNIDSKHIGLMGGSAGGYLVAIAGTSNGVKTFDKGDNLDYSSDVQAVVDTYGVSDLTKIGDDFGPANQAGHKSPGATEALWVNGSVVFGGKDGGIMANPEALRAAQPFTYISAKTAPFLIMYGDADRVVSPSQSSLLYKALRDKGIEASLYNVTGALHGGDYWVQPQVMNIIGEFFDKHLK